MWQLNKVKRQRTRHSLLDGYLREICSLGYGFVDFESQEEAQRVFDVASAEEVSFKR